MTLRERFDSIKRSFPKFKKSRSSSSFTTQRMWVDSSTLTDDLYDELYERNGVAHKIVTKLSNDRFDKWFDINTESEDFKKQLELLNSSKKGGLDIRKQFKIARLFAMRHGYSVIYITYNDQAKDISEPLLNPNYIEKIEVIRKTDINKIILDDDENSENFGDIKHYVLNRDFDGNVGEEVMIHGSRTIHVINDVTKDPRGISLYKPMYNWLNIFDNTAWSIGQSFFRYAGGFPILQVKGWGTLDEERQDEYQNMWANVNSMTGYIMGDGDTVEFKGAEGRALSPKEYFEAGLSLIAAAGDLPYALLIGVNAGAVSGSETNLKDYYSDVSSRQTLEDQPLLEEMYNKLIETGQLTDKEYEIEWIPLFSETQKEMAETSKLEAEAREVMKRTGVITKEFQEDLDNGELIEVEKEEPEPTAPSPSPGAEVVPGVIPTVPEQTEDHKHIDAEKRIEKKNGKKLTSTFAEPRFIKLEDVYFKELDKIFKKMEVASIQVAKGFFTDQQDAINPNDMVKIKTSINKVFSINKKDISSIVKKNIGNAVDIGIETAEKTLDMNIAVPAAIRNEKIKAITTEHSTVVNTLAEDINKDVIVQLGITSLNPVEGFAQIERLIKDSFSSKKARLLMGVGNENNSALNQGNLAGFEGSGVVVGKIWISVVDGVTTDTCISLNGEVRPIGEAFSTGDYAPPASVPPHACRSSLEPVTAAEAQALGLPLSDEIIKIADRVIRQGQDKKDNQLDLTLKKKEIDVLQQKESLIKKLEEDMKTDQDYKCECIKCGNKITSEKHCMDLKCSKCGGQMRRESRPSQGQP